MERPIRLWYLSTQLASIGGAERMLYKVLAGLPQSDFEPEVVLFYQGGDLADSLAKQGVQVHASFARHRFDITGVRKLFDLARGFRPDIVLTTTNLMGYFWATMLRQRGLAQRVVVSFHVTRFMRSYYRAFLRKRMPWIDHFIVLTPLHAEFWKSQLSIPSYRISIIPNGIDTDHFVPFDDTQTLRQSLGIPTNACVVGNVAYFKPVKNLVRFVEVARLVHQQVPEAFFILVGDGSERPAIERAIADANLQDRFLLPGEVANPKSWFQAMDIFLLTSDSEALPVVLLEAGSCGVPAVATDVGGVADVIEHGKTGFVASTNAQELADYVLRLCKDSELRCEMGSQARERVVREFSVQSMVSKYVELFRQLSLPEKKTFR
ncbi:MAG: glycosyltransferase [Fimbriimonadales bacterium]